MTDPHRAGRRRRHTYIKALAATTDGDELRRRRRRDPVAQRCPAAAPRPPRDAVLTEVTATCCADASARSAGGTGRCACGGIGVSGMAEAGRPARRRRPASRHRSSPGSTRAARTRSPRSPDDFRAEFPRRTGLPVSRAGHLRQAAAPAGRRAVAGRPAVAERARVRGRHALGGGRVRRAVAGLAHRAARPGHRRRPGRGPCEVLGVDRGLLPRPVLPATRGGAGQSAVLGDRTGAARASPGRCSPSPGTTTWSPRSAAGCVAAGRALRLHRHGRGAGPGPRHPLTADAREPAGRARRQRAAPRAARAAGHARRHQDRAAAAPGAAAGRA